MSKKVLELVAERHELAHEPGLVVAAEEDDLVGVVDEHGAEVEDDLGGEEAAVDIVAEEDVLHGAAAKLLLGLHGVGEAGDPKDGRGGRRRSSPGAAARRGWAWRASAAAPATASRRPRRTASSRRAAATGTAPRPGSPGSARSGWSPSWFSSTTRLCSKKGHSGTEVDGKATREHLVCWFFSDSKHTSMDRVPTCHLPLFCCFPWGTI